MATTTKQSEHKSHGMEAHLNILDKVTPVDNHITAVQITSQELRMCHLPSAVCHLSDNIATQWLAADRAIAGGYPQKQQPGTKGKVLSFCFVNCTIEGQILYMVHQKTQSEVRIEIQQSKKHSQLASYIPFKTFLVSFSFLTMTNLLNLNLNFISAVNSP